MGCAALKYHYHEIPEMRVIPGEKSGQNNVQWFLSIDPLAAKYAQLSPYNYCAANPIMFVDPDGKEIEISYGNGQKYKYGSSEPVPDDAFVKETINALNFLGSSKSIKDKFTYLNTTKDYTVVIREGSVTQAFTAVSPITYDGKTEQIAAIEQPVYFNENMGLEGKEGGGVLSPAAGLWHELGHVYNAVSNPDEYVKRRTNQFDANSPDGKYHNAEEKYNIQNNEWPLVDEHKMLKRNSHDGSDVNIIKTTGSTSTEKVPEPKKEENKTGGNENE